MDILVVKALAMSMAKCQKVRDEDEARKVWEECVAWIIKLIDEGMEGRVGNA